MVFLSKDARRRANHAWGIIKQDLTPIYENQQSIHMKSLDS
jgi:hypothetical protein